MLVRHSIFYIDSDRDRHFTDSLIQFASEFENITIPGVAGVLPKTTAGGGTALGRGGMFIESVRVLAATEHDWLLAFYSRDVTRQGLITGGTGIGGSHEHVGATPYFGSLIGCVSLNSTTWQMYGTGSTEYVVATDGLSIPYIDEDGLGQLHVGLVNLDTKTKAALGSGNLPSGVGQPYVQIRFGCISASG